MYQSSTNPIICERYFYVFLAALAAFFLLLCFCFAVFFVMMSGSFISALIWGCLAIMNGFGVCTHITGLVTAISGSNSNVNTVLFVKMSYLYLCIGEGLIAGIAFWQYSISDERTKHEYAWVIFYVFTPLLLLLPAYMIYGFCLFPIYKRLFYLPLVQNYDEVVNYAPNYIPRS